MEELGRVPLKAFLELSHRGTMTAVAQELGYTPGAISNKWRNWKPRSGCRSSSKSAAESISPTPV